MSKKNPVVLVTITLKLYLVEPPVEYMDHGSCIEFVICAENEEEARNTHPNGYRMDEVYRQYGNTAYGWVPYNKLNELEITYLGDAKPGLEKGIIIASNRDG